MTDLGILANINNTDTAIQNEIISLRNIGFSLLDIYKPIAVAIFITGLLTLILFNSTK